MVRRVGIASVGIVMVLAVCGCSGPPPASLLPTEGGTRMTFTGLEKRYAKIENVSPSTAGELGESYIEEGGVRKVETTFKVVEGKEIGGTPPCRFPTEKQQLEKKGDACIIGVELLKEGAASATLVMEYGALGGTRNLAKATLPVKR
jgi:hypothetical protein